MRFRRLPRQQRRPRRAVRKSHPLDQVASRPRAVRPRAELPSRAVRAPAHRQPAAPLPVPQPGTFRLPRPRARNLKRPSRLRPPVRSTPQQTVLLPRPARHRPRPRRHRNRPRHVQARSARSQRPVRSAPLPWRPVTQHRCPRTGRRNLPSRPTYPKAMPGKPLPSLTTSMSAAPSATKNGPPPTGPEPLRRAPAQDPAPQPAPRSTAQPDPVADRHRSRQRTVPPRPRSLPRHRRQIRRPPAQTAAALLRGQQAPPRTRQHREPAGTPHPGPAHRRTRRARPDSLR